MSRFSSPERDKRVINLAAEVAETRDRKVPNLLLNLREILAAAPGSTQDGKRVRRECWEYNLVQVLILVLKQDFSIVDGDWQTATALCAILSQICSGIELQKADKKKYEEELLPEAINNMFLVARRIQARVNAIPDRPSMLRERQRLLMCYKGILETITQLTWNYSDLAADVLECPWLLQLLISDEADSVIGVMEMLPRVLRVSKTALSEINKKLRLSILDELIYKLSVNMEVAIGAAAAKCVLRICDYHKSVIDVLCTRYKGLRPLLRKWEGAGFNRDLRDLTLLLQAGNAQRAENERLARAAVTIQAIWKGFIIRKRLNRANKAFTKFHRSFRHKQVVMEQRKELAKEALELERRLKLNRQKIMREFKEKQLHTIEILPASHVDKYFEREQTQAAIQIQKCWRGFHSRQSMFDKRILVQRYKAAVILQRGVRRWLERVEKKKKKPIASLKPAGLTEDRRVQLQQKIIQYREDNPPQSIKREDLEKGHKLAADMLHRYYVTLRSNRLKQQHRDAIMARLETDSELVSLAPSLQSATEKDVEMYSSHSLPIATKARTDHIETLKLLRQPWWKKLKDEIQDQEYEEEDVLLF
ncbi:hypothetical protein FSP39_019392 [Pinctada imbricata]|uniref:IQ calmodulin-binding motif-containing protein 1 n=1 Tax=Pinctada imbricata TaxID=66713 RepID=A0AA88YJH7_PINIB|nr:hypothetical protein FSP39_019392 [Pinctada imbricata]